MNKNKVIILISALGTTVILVSGVAFLNKNSNENLTKNQIEEVKISKDENVKPSEIKEVLSENKNLKDGEFIGEGTGYGGKIKVKVTIKNGKIEEIKVLSHNETPSFFNKTTSVINNMVKQNTVNVDGVSGATYTSNGLKEAVLNALSKAGLDESETLKFKKDTPKKSTVVKSNSSKNINLNVSNNQELKNGEFLGEASGYKGKVKVKVYIENGKVKDIKLISHNDDYEYMNKAKRIISNFLDNPNAGSVDVVSGATYSSKGIINAINNALLKARVNPNNNNVILEKVNFNKVSESKNQANKNDLSNNNAKKIAEKIVVDKDIKGLKDGQYIAQADGFNGKIKVKVSIENGKIIDVSIMESNDDKAYLEMAKEVISKTLKKQSTNDVDTVTGATYSSRGILNAISKALMEAGYKGDIKTIKEKEIAKEKETSKDKDTSKNKEIEKDSSKDKDTSNDKDTSKEKDTSNNKGSLNFADGIYEGKGSGLHKSKFILTKVNFADNKIKNIEVSDKKETYGDDIYPYRKTALPIVDSILKDRDKTINNLLEYDRVMNKLIDVALKNDSDELLKEGKKLIGDYANDFDKIHINKAKGTMGAYDALRNKIKAYFRSQNKAEELDTVSGATYSAIGIVKSVKNAMDKSSNDYQTNNKIQKVVANGLKNNTYNLVYTSDDKRNKKLDLSKISADIHYKDGTVKNVSFNDFEKNGIELISEETKEKMSGDMVIREFIGRTSLLLINKESLSEEKIYLDVEYIDRDYVKNMEYSLNNGKSWTTLDNIKFSGDNASFAQIFDLKDEALNKKIRVRVITKDNKIYNLVPAREEGLIKRGETSLSFESTNEDRSKNKNLAYNYRLDLSYNLSEDLKPIIEVEDQVLTQGNKFDPLKDVKVTNKKGEDLKNFIKINNTVDVTTPGKYKVEYWLEDARKTIYVTVEQLKTDKELTIIASDKTIKVGDVFDPKEGVKAISRTGQDITDSMIISNRVKTDKPGKYIVIYFVRDMDETLRKIVNVTVV